MAQTALNIVILAAGKGTRMYSKMPKVLHRIGGLPMVERVIDTAASLNPQNICVVIGHGKEQVLDTVKRDVVWVEQTEQLGTGHAVKTALPHLSAEGRTLVLYGDVPLIDAATLETLLEAAGDEVGLLTDVPNNPTGLGRIIRDSNGSVTAIVEEKDADAAQKAVKEINTGILVLPNAKLEAWLNSLSSNNAQGEYYLTDLIAKAVADGIKVHPVQVRASYLAAGVNNKLQLAELERIFQTEQAQELLKAGVTLRDPARFDLRGRLKHGQDVVIDVNVVIEGEVELGDNVEIGANCVIKNAKIGANTKIAPFSHFEGCEVGENNQIGPYARLRPQAKLADDVHIGNFVEVKNATIGNGTKANHLTYIGDAEIGSKTNFGAGTIIANYDGVNKHKTVIGANHNVVDFLTDGLKRLEYRGYDSSGIAVNMDGKIKRVRRVGRVQLMEDAAREKGVFGHIGIGHTRWATHGGVTEPNAHPHISGGMIAVVHNGIIENFEAERERLKALGYTFESQTDTEVIAHSVNHEYTQNGGKLFEAVQAATARFHGAYAIAVIAQDNPEEMVVARMGCPLLVALGDQETFIASDVSAVIAFTRRIAYLEDGDIALLNANGIEKLLDKTGAQTERAIKVSELSLASLELGPYSHFMQKEIHEQPRAIADTAEVFLDGGFEPENFGANAREVFDDIHSIKILACGTSYYAALTAKYWLESIAKVPTDVEIASEYRYRDVIADPKQLVITISQSGETLDTMEALKYAQSLGHKHSLSICNVMESALPRESELVLYTRAGAEIGVASTKAFTTQLVVLFGLAVTLGKQRGLVSDEQAREYIEELRQLPGSIQHVLNLEPQIAAWAQKFAKKTSALFLGRGIHFPIALEGALKLKEITYIHAEAYPAGELKHGPLALVDENMPVVVIAPNDSLLDKVKANMQEVGARGGELFVFADLDSNFNATEGVHVIRAPRHVGVLSPIVHTIPVQLLSYHAALARGTDVDKPRNLAKSVTVE